MGLFKFFQQALLAWNHPWTECCRISSQPNNYIYINVVLFISLIIGHGKVVMSYLKTNDLLNSIPGVDCMSLM